MMNMKYTVAPAEPVGKMAVAPRLNAGWMEILDIVAAI